MGQNQSIEKHNETSDNSAKQNNTIISKPINNLVSQAIEKPTKRHQPLPRKSNDLNGKGMFVFYSTVHLSSLRIDIRSITLLYQ